MFLNKTFEFKVSMKTGKRQGRAAQPAGTRPGLCGTPEQIHAKMWPKFQRMDKAARDSEIAVARAAQTSWERKYKQFTPKKRGSR